MSLKRSFIKGTFWMGAAEFARVLIALFVTALLARMLPPSAFGILAMVLAVTAFMDVFVGVGFGNAVVQKTNLDHRALSSIFWFSFGSAVAVSLLVNIGAPLAGEFYQTAEVVGVLRVLSLGFLVGGVMTVPAALLRKNFRFKEIAAINTSSVVVSGAIAIFMAMAGYGYWALVAQQLIGIFLRSLLTFLIAGWRPSATFHWPSILEVLDYSAYLVVFSCVHYWSNHADKLLIGRFLGASQLGFYALAYRLMMMPIRIIDRAVRPVLHPALAAAQTDVDRQRQGYLSVVEVIGLAAFPLAAGLWVIAEPLMLLMWGPNWGPSVEVFKILVVLMAIRPVTTTSGAVYMARDRTKLLLLVAVVDTIGLVGGMALGLRGGIKGVAVGYVLSFILFPMMINLYIVFIRLLDGGIGDIFRAFRKPSFGGGIVFITAYSVRMLTADQVSAVLSMLLVIAVSTLLFLVYVRCGAWHIVKNIVDARRAEHARPTK